MLIDQLSLADQESNVEGGTGNRENERRSKATAKREYCVQSSATDWCVEIAQWKMVPPVCNDVMQGYVGFSSAVRALKRDTRRTRACTISITVMSFTANVGC